MNIELIEFIKVQISKENNIELNNIKNIVIDGFSFKHGQINIMCRYKTIGHKTKKEFIYSRPYENFKNEHSSYYEIICMEIEHRLISEMGTKQPFYSSINKVIVFEDIDESFELDFRGYVEYFIKTSSSYSYDDAEHSVAFYSNEHIYYKYWGSNFYIILPR